MPYDRSIKKYNEPYTPEELDRMVSTKSINKGKFLWNAHKDSYHSQMHTIRNLNDVKSVLEVGPGEGFCAKNLKELGYHYHTLDFESAHEPTFNMDFKTFDPADIPERYDLTCAFQVLEHFPYEDFPGYIQKLCELSTRYVFISLPYPCSGLGFTLNIQLGQNLRLTPRVGCYVPSFLPNRRYRPEFIEEFPWAVHYWEIGRQGFSLRRVLADLKACDLKVVKKFRSLNPYHYFILCKKNNAV